MFKVVSSYIGRKMRLLGLILFVLLSTIVICVDKNNFKRCDQSSFCRRCRKVQPGSSPYSLVSSTLKTFKSYITLDLKNNENGHEFILKLEAVKGDKFHVEIDEKQPLHPRYRVEDALKGLLEYDSLTVSDKNEERIVVNYGSNKAELYINPFKIDFFNSEKLVVSMNSKGKKLF
uniref:CSON011306 protein n=1 Tax=Culicoides sonorensis TaxID=179676 RepID=A0A336LQR0_CULSO